MARTSLSGFPEWLPEGRIIEQFLLDHIREALELHGFSGIEIGAVETLEQLGVKREILKEIYVLDRLQAMKEAEAGRHSSKEWRMGLHFDLTIPFACYVVENANGLDFPLKRYQIQKVWRGERPQEGRFCEFTQADTDVVGEGSLSLHFKADLPLVMAQTLAGLPIPKATVLVNSRKVIQEVCESLGVDNVEAALHGLDKIDKIGPEGVAQELAESKISDEQAETLLAMAQVCSADPAVIRSQIDTLGVPGKFLDEGVSELRVLLESAARCTPGAILVDLKIARGLDYYTGSVYESVIEGYEDLGSICSGGRYGSLAKDGKRTHPGVGLSTGASRLVSRMISTPMVKATWKVLSVMLVAVSDEVDRARSEDTAAAPRSRGIAVDTAPMTAKFGKQIKPADKRGILLVWFPGTDAQGDTVKDIRSGLQVDADFPTWMSSQEDSRSRVLALD